MYEYLKGKIISIRNNSIVIDNNGIGYLIYTPNPFSFTLAEEIKIYIYQYVREEEISLYGFKTIEEKDMFLKLMSVKGIGPKMTLPILAMGSLGGIIEAIERENILYLKKFPKIGDKVARQIILDLKGKLVTNNDKIENESYNDDLTAALHELGYKTGDIKKILPKINHSDSIENQLKEALKMLLK